MPGKIQIILPGLFDLPLIEIPRNFLSAELPHLNRFLRLASTQANQAFSLDAILHNALEWSLPEPMGLPLAQAFAPPEDRHNNHYLLFEAIHLHPDLHSAVIIPIEKNQENLKDINIIINDLKDLFKVDCDISVIADGLFLMHLHAFAAPLHYPHILSVLGKSANPYIEQSRAHLPWYKLLNEMQMFMHQHDINQRRLQQGLNPANSLWCWGGGSLAAAVDGDLAWYCDDPLLCRFAQSLGLNPTANAELDSLAIAGDAIVIDLRLLEALKSGQALALDELLHDIERQIFAPLLQTGATARKQLLLRSGFDLDFNLRPGAGLKFWRRPKNLLDWCPNDRQL